MTVLNEKVTLVDIFHGLTLTQTQTRQVLAVYQDVVQQRLVDNFVIYRIRGCSFDTLHWVQAVFCFCPACIQATVRS